MYDRENETFVNENGDVVATDDMYPIGDFTREIFKSMKAGDTALKSVEEIINQLVNRDGNMYAEDVDLMKEMIEINNALTPEQREQYYRAMDELIEKHGQMKAAKEDKNKDIHFAKKNAEGETIMKNIQTHARDAREEWLTDALVREAVTNEALAYVPQSNAETMRKAQERFNKEGSYEKAMALWNAIVKSGKTPTAVDVAFGELLQKQAGAEGRYQDTVKLTCDLVLMSHTTGQTLQAFRILKKLSANGQHYYLQGVVSQLNKQYAKRIEDPKNPMKKIELKQEYIAKLYDAKTRQQLDDAIEEIKMDIAKQIPPTWLDKWNAWRYLAMLGNPRTHFRNIIGNGAFMPAVFVKDMVARFIEDNFKWVDPSARSRTWNADLSKDSVYMKRAEEDFEVMKKLIAGESGGNKYSDANEILSMRRVFKWDLLDKLEKFNGEKLGEEDVGFMAKYYKRAFAEFLQARGITEDQINTFDTTRDGRKILNEARMWAMNEAQRNTYHDASSLATSLNQLKRKNGVYYVLLEGLVPFTKTPANILKRGLEYSPIGLISSIVNLNRDLRSGEYSTSECIDRLAAGITGTGLMLVGFILSKMGLLRGAGSPDDKEHEFEALQGHQDWSLEIPWAGGKKASYTIDWMAPSALPLFVGNALYSLMKGDGVDLSDIDTYAALLKIADPMLALSMLDGIENTLSSISNTTDSSKLGVLAMSMATSYLAQGVPTLFGQVARSLDKDRRSTYIQPDSKSQAMNRFIQSSLQGKIPVWENKKMAYVDEWGRTDSSESVGEAIWKIFENFLSPGYGNIINDTPVDHELQRLYESIGEDAKIILPNKGNKSFNVGDGEDKYTKNMTAEEYEQYSKIRGQTRYAMLADMFNRADYQDMSDLEKITAIDNAYKYADNVAKQAVAPDKDFESHWMETAQKIGAVDYIMLKNDLESNKSAEKIFAMLATDPRLDANQVATLIAERFNSPDFINSTDQTGYRYQLNESDDEPLEEMNEAIVREMLPKLYADSRYIDGDALDRADLLAELYSNAREATLQNYEEILSRTDRVATVGKASAIGKKSFEIVMDLYDGDIQQQAEWLIKQYKPDKTISNPLHEGYELSLDDYARNNVLPEEAQTAFVDAYTDLLTNNAEFKAAEARGDSDWMYAMIMDTYNKTIQTVEDAYASEMYQQGAEDVFKDKPTGYNWKEGYAVAAEHFGNDYDSIGHYLAQIYSTGSTIKDVDRPGYVLTLSSAQQQQADKDFDQMFTTALNNKASTSDFQGYTLDQQQKAVDDLRKQVIHQFEEEYSRKLVDSGFYTEEISLNGNTDEFNKLLANENFSKEQAIDLMVEKYEDGLASMTNWEAKDFRVNAYRDYLEANWDSRIVKGTEEEFKKLRSSYKKDRGAAYYANELVKKYYGVKNLTSIPDIEYDIPDINPAFDSGNARRTTQPVIPKASTSTANTTATTTTTSRNKYVIPPAAQLDDAMRYRKYS